MEACPKNTTFGRRLQNGMQPVFPCFSVCLDFWAWGWGVVLSMVSLLLSIMPYNVSRFLGINFMDAYDVYQ